jgi:tetratricopeptide (TPR) repeat protein
MRTGALWLAVPLALAFTLGLRLQQVAWPAAIGSQSGGSLTTVFLGDSRKLLANHFFIKADAYFHSGYYPSLFDNQAAHQTPHIAEDAGQAQGNNACETLNFLGPPRNWIDRFGRQFYPSTHTHLGEGRADQDAAGQEREILPWIRLATELDPQNPLTYTVGAYWLRTLKQDREAEQFLREGLRAIPNNPQILHELGRIYRENRHDPNQARNLWELALRRWDEQESGLPEPNIFVRVQILGQLARVEEEAGRRAQALHYLELVKPLTSYPDAIQKWIDRVK